MRSFQLTVVVAALVFAAACSSPQDDWQKAEAENTEAAYLLFLETYPEGEWAEKAQAQLDTIKDTRDWTTALTTDTVDAYNEYLSAHANGAHTAEASSRITDLNRETAWLAAQQDGSKEALESFLSTYPEAPHADQARALIEALAPPPPPPPTPAPAAAPAKKPAKAAAGGDYRVQLGAFSTLAKAKAELASAERQYRSIVGSLSIQQPTGSDKLFRVRSEGMTEAAARSACRKIKPCLVVRR